MSSSINVSAEIAQQRADIDKVGEDIKEKEKKWENALNDGKTELAAGLDKSLTALRASLTALRAEKAVLLNILQAKLTGGGGLCFCLCL